MFREPIGGIAGLADALSRTSKPGRHGIRTSPAFKVRCFCGFDDFLWLTSPNTSVYGPGEIVKTIRCPECKAWFVLQNTFRHVERDGVDFYGFQQLDHDPTVRSERAEAPITEGTYR